MKPGKLLCRAVMAFPAIASVAIFGTLFVLMAPLVFLIDWLERAKSKLPKWIKSADACAQESWLWWMEKLTLGLLKESDKRNGEP